jgi:hypothetical protein
MPINTNANFVELSAWLNENLTDEKRIKAYSDEVKKVPETKGIYFWFMHPNGYEALSNHVRIEPVEPKYTRNIDGVKYDLVYLGTAGTGKKGGSNLCERFAWHIIKPHHTDSNICHGTLSTLRAGLGALLSNDLILLNTEEMVNAFMKKYMKVFWIEYPADKSLIDNDEKILIKVIRPLLNLKNNPNARANTIANASQLYKIRRAEVYKNTRLRLGCGAENQIDRENNNPRDDTPQYNYQIISDNCEGCVEYFVLQQQHIGIVTRGILGLPLGKSKITIYDSLNPNNEFIQWRRVTGNNNNHDAQNIYKYFDNTSSNGTRRFQVIQDWMIENHLNEITIRVCPLN